MQAIFQMHRNLLSTPEENTDSEYIANAAEKCNAEIIKLVVAPDAKSFTVTVGSNGKPRRFETRNER
jgi:hypothetical protein